MTAPADLAEVRAALALVGKATPGPWSSEDGSTTWGDDADLWSRIRDASGAVVSDMFEVTGRPHRQVSADAAAIVALRNAAPAIAAAVEELERLRTAVDEREGDMHLRIRAGYDKTVADAWRAVVAKRDAEIAALNRQVCRLVSGQEIDGDHLCQHHGADVAALALLADERAAHAETSRDLDALLTALGAQVTPGGQTLEACHARRVADGMRRARELVAARAVPADVEAAIASLDAAAYRRGRDPAKVGGPPSASAAARVNARAGLRATINRAIASGRAQGRADLDAELRRAVELRAQAVREAHSGALAGIEEAARLELEAAGLASYGDSPETTAREAHIFAVRCVKRAVAAEARLREIEAAAKETDDAR